MLLKIVVRAQDNEFYSVNEETVIIVPVESYSHLNSSEEISRWYFDPKHFPMMFYDKQLSTNLCSIRYANVYLCKEPQSDISYLLFFSSSDNGVENIGSRKQFDVASVTVVSDYPEP